MLLAVPHLQRRDRHDHPDGRHLRDRVEHAPERRSIGAIVMVQFVGDAVRLAVREAGRPHRRQAGDLPVAGGLHCISIIGYIMTAAAQFYLLAFLVGDGSGRQPGAGALAFRDNDPASQVVRVLRLLRGVREVRRHFGPALFGDHESAHRIRPQCHPVGDCVLRRRGALLAFVDVEEGQRAAEEADRAVQPAV